MLSKTGWGKVYHLEPSTTLPQLHLAGVAISVDGKWTRCDIQVKRNFHNNIDTQRVSFMLDICAASTPVTQHPIRLAPSSYMTSGSTAVSL
jgi:hypothetical protein